VIMEARAPVANEKEMTPTTIKIMQRHFSSKE